MCPSLSWYVAYIRRKPCVRGAGLPNASTSVLASIARHYCRERATLFHRVAISYRCFDGPDRSARTLLIAALFNPIRRPIRAFSIVASIDRNHTPTVSVLTSMVPKKGPLGLHRVFQRGPFRVLAEPGLERAGRHRSESGW